MHGGGAGRGLKSRSRSIALAAGLRVGGRRLRVFEQTAQHNRLERTRAGGGIRRLHGARTACRTSPTRAPAPGSRSRRRSTRKPPTYISAHRACAKLRPGALVPRAMSERQERQLVGSARCMREYGVSVADPTFQGPYITLGACRTRRQCNRWPSSAPRRRAATLFRELIRHDKRSPVVKQKCRSAKDSGCSERRRCCRRRTSPADPR